ncbi:ABC transporter ATP-binding protein [Marinicrinis lubricantis]|uniref:ABC transporter ATP-binding protein n=1 Tax=Marinicrinis lubricantis TaxID=2086470 RepID=A0ABW1IV67_9BACL
MRLEAEKISFRYGREPWILGDVSFSISSGEIVGLSGASGGGKTTLARILAGYEQPAQGSVRLDGRPLQESGDGAHPVQLVFQHPEQAVNPLWKSGDTLREGGDPDSELLRQLGIEPDWLTRWPSELSGGELQRICVARALLPSTQFLIADEMTTMLDAITQAQIWQAVLHIAEQRQMGVLVISHDPHLLKRLCSRIVRLDELQPCP